MRDKTVQSAGIEWHRGELSVLDNPTGVMTNGPEFAWHLTNLGNDTHLSYVDVASTTFGDLAVSQPDSDIATASIPSSNTSVERFIKAIFYSKFTEKARRPDMVMMSLARITDHFDRPRGATIDPGTTSHYQGAERTPGTPPTEYTSWISLADLERGIFLIHSYESFNYSSCGLTQLSREDTVRVGLLGKLSPLGGDATDTPLVAPPAA